MRTSIFRLLLIIFALFIVANIPMDDLRSLTLPGNLFMNFLRSQIWLAVIFTLINGMAKLSLGM